MSPLDGQRVRFPGYSLELTGRGEVLFYRTALRHLAAALTWSDGAALLDAQSLTVTGGLLRYAVSPRERTVVVHRMLEFLRDGGRVSASVESPFSLDAPAAALGLDAPATAPGRDTIGAGGAGASTPASAGRHEGTGRVVGAGCAGALLGALLGGVWFASVGMFAGGQVPVPPPRDLHNPGQLLLYAFVFAVGAVPGALGGAVAGAFLAWVFPPRGARPGPPAA